MSSAVSAPMTTEKAVEPAGEQVIPMPTEATEEAAPAAPEAPKAQE